ncbi:polysaccharide export protein [Novosphingobium flavum]|uniref:Polysaccharide export protein n=1 Tax=Novosphingobium flavum TaxID=1778672 RepID=A0A7X1FQ37_9SPHN|nr:polysaccharide biosynthesis/export family protein [Novosphingobium flavum]MBC2664457.1 polysaccharide export protein [Novosphingobium flavum]
MIKWIVPVLSCCFLPALLAGCATAGPSPLPTGAEAYAVIPEHVAASQAGEIIAPGDKLDIRVFGEPELSGDGYVVDNQGFIQVPLVGEIIASGQTARGLADELQRRLAARYLRNPSVTVALAERPLSTYTVEGDVTAPGVFAATPSTTLLTAMAQAKSPTKTARTNDVIVFRQINGQKAGGRFDLNAIRRGRSPDPQVLAGDTVVVVNSAAKSAWRDVLAALPLLNTFVLLRQN